MAREMYRQGDLLFVRVNELLRIPFGGEEPIMLVKVRDPSTGRFHILRVPPSMRTCRQAIAWTF